MNRLDWTLEFIRFTGGTSCSKSGRWKGKGTKDKRKNGKGPVVLLPKENEEKIV